VLVAVSITDTVPLVWQPEPVLVMWAFWARAAAGPTKQASIAAIAAAISWRTTADGRNRIECLPNVVRILQRLLGLSRAAVWCNQSVFR
jgi:hypothetical protein